MIAQKMNDLEAAREKVARLEQLIASDLQRELASLPARYGYDNVNAFLRAVRLAADDAMIRNAGGRKRARITDATRVHVKRLVHAGKTGREIAECLGISLPSVQNIKKALGLIRTK